MSSCAICEKRRPRRYCPGVRGDICPTCCGTEREVTVECPLDCEYLREARQHEPLPDVNPDEFPNRDIRVTEQFLVDHEHLLVFTAQSLLKAMMETSGAVDNDAREALDAMIRTHRTMESGLIYETRPANPYAESIRQKLQNGFEELRKHLLESSGMHSVRDSEILGVLVFLQRLEIQHNNGRRRGRAFLDFLRGHFPPAEESNLVTA